MPIKFPLTEKTTIVFDKKLTTKLVIAFIIVVAFYWFGGHLYAPGVNVDAEKYELNVNESTLIEAIENFKKENPQYNVPPIANRKDGRCDKDDYGYRIYFYYPKEDQIIITFARETFVGKTTFAFVAVNQGLAIGNAKGINQDFSRKENRMQIQLFEERILNKVKEKLHL